MQIQFGERPPLFAVVLFKTQPQVIEQSMFLFLSATTPTTTPIAPTDSLALLHNPNQKLLEGNMNT